ncbi:pyridoxamine 5'-phosphate oxidase family protein [Pokkaliibacter sp. MBI-7]|uniref:HugZ family pyridoxamine 5'-phosphate oxidase n=1 Tax=Pokkaliibacter sp. MBI-7 TaxID=3040600 RepID=UPI00244A00CA|nr:pyridoxamine 5'-phosphate oxidase family protein [Pokkaliibacter sp. MBI-7]MDH2434934.1 pyridoxamine 5'-phosphate oxidase family protein [Pokkaliibacter sp. MBI-7]
MDEQEQQLLRIYDQQLAFRQQCRCLMMATQDQQGWPEVSYTPYVEDDEGFLYIYISELAAHTRNLLNASPLSVMFIEDESQAKVIHARERLSFRVSVTEVQRDAVLWSDIQQRLSARFGEVALMLKDLQDFHMFQLAPIEGVYVRGFAKAYRIYRQGIEHIRDIGHRPVSEVLR